MSFDSEEARLVDRIQACAFYQAKEEFDEDLFQNLLCSMPERLKQVREAEGGHTDY